jgi:hypothetical protein
MKPHPRIRKTIKWGGAAVTVLLVVVWIGSGWCSAGFSLERRMLWVDGGQAKFGRFPEFAMHGRGPEPSPTQVFANVHRTSFEPLCLWVELASPGSFPGGSVPLWMPVVLLLPPTAAAWRLDILARRRARLNLCPKCHYDRAGLGAGAVCPECGSKPS